MVGMSRLAPASRKALLTLHLVTALGWLGADLVLLTLGVAGLRGADPAAVYPTAALVVTYLFAPLSVVVWLVGVVSSLLDPVGAAALAVGAGQVRAHHRAARPGPAAADAPDPELCTLGAAASTHYRVDLVVAPAVSSTLLLIATVLSTYKPWGRLRPAPGPPPPGAAAPRS